MITQPGQPPGIWRRLGALAYDLLALLAIWFFATLFVVIVSKGAAIEAGNPFYTLYLIALAWLYCGFCWTRSGQTLGMRSWKFAVVTSEAHARLDWPRATLRFASAAVSLLPLGLGLFWSLVDSAGRSWHDRLSRTELCDVRYG